MDEFVAKEEKFTNKIPLINKMYLVLPIPFTIIGFVVTLISDGFESDSEQDYDTGVELFRSGVMPVGSRIEKMKLNKELEEGEYSAVITFHQLESDGETEHAKVSVAYTLNVTK